MSGDYRDSKTSFSEHWNSSFLKQVRQKIRDGESIKECSACDHENNPYRQFFNERYAHKTENALSLTERDGHYHGLPESIDYRVNHLCNFKCLMCGPHYSKSWESEWRRQGREKQLPVWQTRDRENTEKFQAEVAVRELIEWAQSGRISDIYWAGGEPMVNPTHWDVMKILVEQQKAQKTHVRYTTNLSHIEFKGVQLTELLSHFPYLEMGVSIDAIGELGEYLRQGLQWSRWVKNLNVVRQMIQEPQQIYLEHHLTLPGIVGLLEIVEFASQNKILLRSKIVDMSVEGNELSPLHPLFLPHSVLEEKIVSLLKNIEIQEHGYTTWVSAVLMDLLHQSKNRKKTNLKNKKQKLESLLKQDMHRYGYIKLMEFFSDWSAAKDYLSSLQESGRNAFRF